MRQSGKDSRVDEYQHGILIWPGVMEMTSKKSKCVCVDSLSHKDQKEKVTSQNETVWGSGSWVK